MTNSLSDRIESKLVDLCKPSSEEGTINRCKECGNEMAEDNYWLCDPCNKRKELERIERDREREREERLSRWARATPKLYQGTDLEHPEFNSELYESIKEWEPNNGKGLGVYGDPGTCKTRVVFLILRRQMLLNGVGITSISGSSFARLSQNQFNENKGGDSLGRGQMKGFQELSSRWRKAGILFLDDIDKVPKWTDRLESDLFELLEHRTSNCRPTLWTANCSLETLEGKMTDHRGPAIARRLREFSSPILSVS